MITLPIGNTAIDLGPTDRGLALQALAVKLHMEGQVSAKYALEFVACTVQVLETFSLDATRLDKLREACGYVEEGSSRSLSIGQDDSTKFWMVSAGRDRGYGSNLREAIDNLVRQEDSL